MNTRREPRERIRYNHFIRVPQVRVITSTGEQAGVMPTNEALRMAINSGKDLVEIAPNANPPVCKIIEIGKLKYEMAKKKKEAKKKQHVMKVKEIKLRPMTDDHDYQYKIGHAREFIQNGDRVKITVVFRGREMAHIDLGKKILDRAKEDLADITNVDMEGKMEGRRMIAVLAPMSSKQKVSKRPKEKPQQTVNKQEGQ